LESIIDESWRATEQGTFEGRTDAQGLLVIPLSERFKTLDVDVGGTWIGGVDLWPTTRPSSGVIGVEVVRGRRRSAAGVRESVIRGTVSSEAGGPIAGAVITADPIPELVSMGTSIDAQKRLRATSDATGSFEIEGVPTNTLYRLQATSSDLVSETVEPVRPGAQATITISSRAPNIWRIRDSLTGKPIRSGTVVVVAATGAILEGRAIDEEGTATVPAWGPTAKYWMTAPGYEARWVLPTETRARDVRLAPSVPIRGVLVAADGSPVAGMLIAMWPAVDASGPTFPSGEDGGCLPGSCTSSKSDGSFVLDHAGPGACWVGAGWSMLPLALRTASTSRVEAQRRVKLRFE
jgi:hypothetical protein